MLSCSTVQRLPHYVKCTPPWSHYRGWIWKAFSRNTRQLIDWECGGRGNGTFSKRYERLKKWNVSVCVADGWQAYSDIIPSKSLIQTKSETHLIESNNMPQRHWFARFRRKTVCVSRSKEMVDLIVGLYSKFHANIKINHIHITSNIIIWSTRSLKEGYAFLV